MRLRIRTADYAYEFSGPPEFWNEVLRPVLGGPPAPESPERAVTQAAPQAERRDVAAAGGDAETARRVYRSLAERPGRRGEKDAVLAAVWYVGGGRRDVTFGEVTEHVSAFGAFPGLRVKPYLLKHVSRTHMLAMGAERNTFRLSEKGRDYARGHFS